MVWREEVRALDGDNQIIWENNHYCIDYDVRRSGRDEGALCERLDLRRDDGGYAYRFVPVHG